MEQTHLARKVFFSVAVNCGDGERAGSRSEKSCGGYRVGDMEWPEGPGALGSTGLASTRRGGIVNMTSDNSSSVPEVE